MLYEFKQDRIAGSTGVFKQEDLQMIEQSILNLTTQIERTGDLGGGFLQNSMRNGETTVSGSVLNIVTDSTEPLSDGFLKLDTKGLNKTSVTTVRLNGVDITQDLTSALPDIISHDDVYLRFKNGIVDLKPQFSNDPSIFDPNQILANLNTIQTFKNFYLAGEYDGQGELDFETYLSNLKGDDITKFQTVLDLQNSSDIAKLKADYITLTNAYSVADRDDVINNTFPNIAKFKITYDNLLGLQLTERNLDAVIASLQLVLDSDNTDKTNITNDFNTIDSSLSTVLAQDAIQIQALKDGIAHTARNLWHNESIIPVPERALKDSHIVRMDDIKTQVQTLLDNLTSARNSYNSDNSNMNVASFTELRDLILSTETNRTAILDELNARLVILNQNRGKIDADISTLELDGFSLQTADMTTINANADKLATLITDFESSTFYNIVFGTNNFIFNRLKAYKYLKPLLDLPYLNYIRNSDNIGNLPTVTTSLDTYTVTTFLADINPEYMKLKGYLPLWNTTQTPIDIDNMIKFTQLINEIALLTAHIEYGSNQVNETYYTPNDVVGGNSFAFNDFEIALVNNGNM